MMFKFNKQILLGILLSLAQMDAHSQVYSLYGPANGIQKGSTSTYQNTSATSSDIMALFSGGLFPVTDGGTGVGTLTGLALGNGTSPFSAYSGTSCTNQFPRSLNSSGAATCNKVSLSADVTSTLPASEVGAAGSNTQIQWNNSGVLGASPSLTWNNSTTTINTPTIQTHQFQSSIAPTTDTLTFFAAGQWNWFFDAGNIVAQIDIQNNSASALGGTQVNVFNQAQDGITIGVDNTNSTSDSILIYGNGSLSPPTSGLVGFVGGFNPFNTCFTAGTNPLCAILFDVDLNTVIIPPSSATSDTTGFLYIPSVAGVPTGTPSDLGSGTNVYAWSTPIRFDRTHTRLYAYNSGWKNLADFPTNPVLTGTTGSIGGSALLAGACAAGTATVTGATTSMVASTSPSSDPDSSLSTGVAIYAFVSASNTVTVRVCAIVAVTPTATTYNVRVIQ